MPSSTSAGLKSVASPSRLAWRENTPGRGALGARLAGRLGLPRPDADQQVAVRAAHRLARPALRPPSASTSSWQCGQ